MLVEWIGLTSALAALVLKGSGFNYYDRAF